MFTAFVTSVDTVDPWGSVGLIKLGLASQLAIIDGVFTRNWNTHLSAIKSALQSMEILKWQLYKKN